MENVGVKKYERFEKQKFLKQLGVYNNCLYEAKTPKEVFDSLTEEEQEIWKEHYSKNKRISSVFNARLTAEIAKAYEAGFNSNHESLKEVKEILFKNAKRDIVILIGNILCKYDTKYTFKELFEKSVDELEIAWTKYLVKTPEEVEEDLENGKMPFASFSTFASTIVKRNLQNLVWQESREKSVFSINRSMQDKLFTVAHAINNLQCQGVFEPTPLQVQNEILTFRKNGFHLGGIKKVMEAILGNSELTEKVTKEISESGLTEEDKQKINGLTMELTKILTNKIGDVPTSIWFDFCASTENRETTIKVLSDKYGVRIPSMETTIENIEGVISDSIAIQRIIRKINKIRQN